MKPINLNTLVIAPYTKRFGIAVFGRSELLHFSVHQYKTIRDSVGRDSSNQSGVGELISDFKPKMIMLKSLTVRQGKSEVQRDFSREVMRIAAAESIRVDEVDFDRIKSKFPGNQKITQRQLFANLAVTFPELTRIVKFQNPAQAEYYTPVLSAIAIGASELRAGPVRNRANLIRSN
jgi:hypothetical protein